MHLGYRGDASPRRQDDAPELEDRPPEPEPALTTGRRKGRRKVTVWAALTAVVVAVAVVVRFTAWSHLWLDETLSVNIARLPLGDIGDALRHDGAPPLYYFLLHGWMEVFGTGTIAVRALSGLFAVAALPLIWVAGRRLGGRRVAVAALLLLAVSPFAVRYATEARMYSMVTLMALIGWLVLNDLLERFSWPRAVVVSALTGMLLLTHYWSFFLLAVTTAIVARRAGRGPKRSEARRALVAIAVGSLAFLPWLPSFLFQLSHTGTPWAGAPSPRILFDTVFEFSGGMWDPGFILGLLAWVLIILALFGCSVDGRHIELDLRTRPETHPLVLVGFGSLTLALVVGIVSQSGYAVRYASVLFPFFVLLVALGTARLADVRVFRAVMALVVVLGFTAIAPGVFGERTSAAEVARILRDQARPGDVVAYCPDQVAPAVSRVLGDDTGLVQIPFPSGGSPDRVDWVDYANRNKSAATASFTRMLLDRAGPDHDVWFVWAPDYLTFGTKCTALENRLRAARPSMDRVMRISGEYFERPGVIRFRPT